VNGFRLTDIALQAEIERHRKTDDDDSNNSHEEVIVRGLRDVPEHESETSQKATNV
jgi:phosphopantetheine adenylyltransferase